MCLIPRAPAAHRRQFFSENFLDLCDGLRHSEGNALSLHEEGQETLTGSSVLILYSDHWGEYSPTETEFVPINVVFPLRC